MRLIRINAPAGKGADVAQTAFSVGIEKVSIFQLASHRADGDVQTKDAVDIETETVKFFRTQNSLYSS